MPGILQADNIFIRRLLQNVIVRTQERTVLRQAVMPVVDTRAGIEVTHHQPVLRPFECRVKDALRADIFDFRLPLGVPAFALR